MLWIRTGRVAQAVEHLTSKGETLSSVPPKKLKSERNALDQNCRFGILFSDFGISEYDEISLGWETSLNQIHLCFICIVRIAWP
jgi:hypothetical protein